MSEHKCKHPAGAIERMCDGCFEYLCGALSEKSTEITALKAENARMAKYINGNCGLKFAFVIFWNGDAQDSGDASKPPDRYCLFWSQADDYTLMA